MVLRAFSSLLSELRDTLRLNILVIGSESIFATGFQGTSIPSQPNSSLVDISKKMSMFCAAKPYPWPFDGKLRPDNTVFLVIDMQVDFCGEGGYVDRVRLYR